MDFRAAFAGVLAFVLLQIAGVCELLAFVLLQIARRPAVKSTKLRTITGSPWIQGVYESFTCPRAEFH